VVREVLLLLCLGEEVVSSYLEVLVACLWEELELFDLGLVEGSSYLLEQEALEVMSYQLVVEVHLDLEVQE
jgi:hypothetical protein